MPKSDDDKPQLPTIREWLSEWAGVQLPGLPSMPQTLKNLDKAVGNVVLSLGDNAKARIDANTGKVKKGGKIEIDDLVRNAEERRKLENRAAITQIAAEEIKSNPGSADATAEIEADWLNTFSRAAEDKSSDDLRVIFGKILAGEIRRPGTFSLRTINFVNSLTRDEAEAISKFFSYSFEPGYVPNMDNLPGLDINDRLAMEELGLASSPAGIGGLSWGNKISTGQSFALISGNKGIIVYNNSEIELDISIPCQILSKLARELIPIANPNPIDISFLRSVGKELIKIFSKRHKTHVQSGNISVSLILNPEEKGWLPSEQISPE